MKIKINNTTLKHIYKIEILKLSAIFDDFVHTIFPENCYACNTVLVAGEKIICTNCRLTLPLTNHLNSKENELFLRFYGRISLEFAVAFLMYGKQSRVQNILRAIKYEGSPEVANYFGKWMAEELIFNSFESKFDVIIPVPLHQNRQKIRGYNQAEELAKPIAEGLKIELGNHIVERKKHTVSQTKLSQTKRFENVQNIFFVKKPTDIKGKSILLIDDVITTGSTIESLANEILKSEPKSLNMITLADAFGEN